MTRFASAVLLGLALTTAPADAQPGPPQGKETTVEFTEKHQVHGPYRVMQFFYDIQQGDYFRVQASGANGVQMQFLVKACKLVGTGQYAPLEEATSNGKSLDWTGEKRLPSTKARIDLLCTSLGKVNVRITRVDATGKEYPAAGGLTPAPPMTAAPPASPGVEARLQRLERQQDEIAGQLAEIRRLLGQKK